MKARSFAEWMVAHALIRRLLMRSKVLLLYCCVQLTPVWILFFKVKVTAGNFPEIPGPMKIISAASPSRRQKVFSQLLSIRGEKVQFLTKFQKSGKFFTNNSGTVVLISWCSVGLPCYFLVVEKSETGLAVSFAVTQFIKACQRISQLYFPSRTVLSRCLL